MTLRRSPVPGTDVCRASIITTIYLVAVYHSLRKMSTGKTFQCPHRPNPHNPVGNASCCGARHLPCRQAAASSADRCHSLRQSTSHNAAFSASGKFRLCLGFSSSHKDLSSLWEPLVIRPRRRSPRSPPAFRLSAQPHVGTGLPDGPHITIPPYVGTDALDGPYNGALNRNS